MAHLCHIPAVLQVNQEARGEGLRLHKLRFPDTNPTAPPGAKSYFASSDILFLLPSSFRQEPRPEGSSPRHDDPIMALFALTKSLSKDQLDRVQSLAVDVRCGSHLAQPRDFLSLLRGFKGLKLLLFVLNEGKGYQEGGIFIHPPFHLREECLAMHLKIQKIYEDGQNDIVQPKAEWHIVSLGRDQVRTMVVWTMPSNLSLIVKRALARSISKTQSVT